MLKLREESLQGLFESARERLTELTKDSKKYKALLEELLLQGLFDLHETSVEVIARSGDVQLVQEVSDSAIKRYTDETGRKANINVKEGLSKDSAGGLILTGLNGRIQLNNTLEERLHLLEDKMLPELRLDLFGPNKDRKFLS